MMMNAPMRPSRSERTQPELISTSLSTMFAIVNVCLFVCWSLFVGGWGKKVHVTEVNNFVEPVCATARTPRRAAERTAGAQVFVSRLCVCVYGGEPRRVHAAPTSRLVGRRVGLQGA
jgi:hypothetical protein